MRIEHDVTAAVAVELLHELTSGVINDGAFPASGYLVKHFADDARLAGTGISNEKEVLVFCIARNAQRPLVIISSNADSIAGDRLCELRCGDEDWALQTAPVP